MAFGKLKSRGSEYLAVFLGNPGPRYEFTRHNAGFLTADRLAGREKLKITKVRFKGLWCRWDVEGESVICLKPMTYMNLSGEAARAAADFFKIPRERVIAVYDDVSLPLGKLRLRSKGSAGGHNGVKSLISHLGGDDFPRIKIGVGAPPHPDYDMADWVTARLTEPDQKALLEAADRAAEALRCIVTEGLDRAMNKYSG